MRMLMFVLLLLVLSAPVDAMGLMGLYPKRDAPAPVATSAPVALPEPSALVLFGMGLSGVLLLARRRR